MLGLGSELGIFSIDKIKLGFSIAKSMNRVDIIYSYEPNVGGFKKVSYFLVFQLLLNKVNKKIKK